MVRRPQITGNTWFNSHPLSERDVADKVVLVDFWTYSCVNCLRTLPHLRSWWEKYKDKGLEIIGIHTPEFEFEKNPENVQYALKKLDVTWPVVLDNDRENWNNFANKYWPSKYLSDRKGKIVHEHYGEGAYHETERQIRQLLEEKKATEAGIEPEEHFHGSVCFTPTPELYAGYKRGKLANPEQAIPDTIAEYVRPEPMPEDSVGLEGSWIAAHEYAESVKEDSQLHLQFHATEVNVVCEPVEERTILQISFNGLPLERDYAGIDVTPASEIEATDARMYNIFKNRERAEGIITLKPTNGRVRVYAFTFSGCEE